MNTLHCKRCKNMWKTGEEHPENSAPCGYAGKTSTRASRITRKADTMETQMEKRMDDYLGLFHGKFCMDTIAWKSGDISRDLFLRYLKNRVRTKALAEKKDRYGRIWYLKIG